MTRVSAIVPLALVAAGVGVAQTSVGRRALGSVDANPTAAPYVELAFTHPQATVTDAQQSLPHNVQFELRRSSGSTPVAWTVQLQIQGRAAREIGSGTSTARAGSWTVINQALTTKACGTKSGRARVDVRAGADSVGFWTTCGGSS